MQIGYANRTRFQCFNARAAAAVNFGVRYPHVTAIRSLSANAPTVIGATRRWLEKSVIGLNLCPFAAGVYRADRVRFRVSESTAAAALLADLRAELRRLKEQDPAICETTLLIHPQVLTDFSDYNEFLAECDAALADMGLDGTLQIASFHPDYRFAGSQSGDVANCTNRSPFPMLHLLREASITRALAGVADPAEIYRRNIRTLRALGHEGWQRLLDDTL
jgi:hypothetical protein